MSINRLYTDIKVYADGALLTQQNQVQLSLDSGNKEVMTTALGFAGISPGAGITRAQIRNAILATGVEFNPIALMKSRRTVELTFFLAGQQITGDFFIMSATLSHAANAESELNFDCMSSLADLQ